MWGSFHKCGLVLLVAICDIPTCFSLQPPSSSSRTSLPNSIDADVTIVSTKRNGGHMIRYNIPNNPTLPAPLGPIDPSKSNSVPPQGQLESVSLLQKYITNYYWRNVWSLLSTLVQKEYWSSMYDRIRSGLRSTFLPIGYPHTVPPDYGPYVLWSSTQDLCTSVRSVIATQRVLQGIGVGTNTATTLSAIQNFLLRDAAGMFATLSFTAVTSGIFAKDVKRWRLFADCMVDIGITLEVMAVQLPKIYFVPMLCVANMCKAVCGVAAGATSGSIALYWSSKANAANGAARGSGSGGGDTANQIQGKSTESTDISDIHAKFGAQNTIVGSFGLIFSALFARSVATAPLSFVWMIYSILTIFHIYANMQCMRIIAFPQFNTIRLNHVVTSFFDQWYASMAESPPPTNRVVPNMPLPTPMQVAKVESLFFLNNSNRLRQRQQLSNQSMNNRIRNVLSTVWQRPRVIPIHFGVSFNEYIDRCAASLDMNHIKDILLDTQQSTNNNPYIISIGSSNGPTTNERSFKNCCLVVTFRSNTNAYSQAQAYFHAMLYRRIIHNVQTTTKSATTTTTSDDHDRTVREMIEQQVQNTFPLAWESFVKECDRAGWDLSRTDLHSKGYEIAYQPL